MGKVTIVGYHVVNFHDSSVSDTGKRPVIAPTTLPQLCTYILHRKDPIE